MTMTDPSTGGTAHRDQVVELVRAMAPESEISGGDGDLADASRLVEDLGYQSLRLIELTMTLEETFDLPPFDREILAAVRTVGDVVSLINRHVPDSGSQGAGS